MTTTWKDVSQNYKEIVFTWLHGERQTQLNMSSDAEHADCTDLAQRNVDMATVLLDAVLYLKEFSTKWEEAEIPPVRREMVYSRLLTLADSYQGHAMMAKYDRLPALTDHYEQIEQAARLAAQGLGYVGEPIEEDFAHQVGDALLRGTATIFAAQKALR